MNYTTYIMSCNFAIDATCLLTFTTYEYSDLQMSCITQKLNCKASCKNIIFFHSVLLVCVHVNHMIYEWMLGWYIKLNIVFGYG